MNDQPYSIIERCSEKGKFHVQCLEQWLQKSNNGIFTQDKIETYSIYQNNILINLNTLIKFLKMIYDNVSQKYTALIRFKTC